MYFSIFGISPSDVGLDGSAASSFDFFELFPLSSFDLVDPFVLPGQNKQKLPTSTLYYWFLAGYTVCDTCNVSNIVCVSMNEPALSEDLLLAEELSTFTLVLSFFSDPSAFLSSTYERCVHTKKTISKLHKHAHAIYF